MSGPLLEVVELRVGLLRGAAVHYAVDGVSFHVAAGETVGLVGESGSGKSTTGLALLRLNPRSSRPYVRGRIIFDGRDVLTMTEKEVRSLRGTQISMILQDPIASLNPVFTIGDQIEEAIRTHRRLAPREARAAALAALRDVRIPAAEARIDAYPHELSGGMRQRVVGAIAIACRPRLLIADEPTTSLDVTVQAQYLQLLEELQREIGMAMIFITHDFGIVARMCRRVCVMYAGRIVETAPVDDIFHRAAHWYTAGLVASVPRLGRHTERLIAIPGAPPRPGEIREGCPFAPRCPNARPRCRSETPPATGVGTNHTVSCWYPREGA